MEEKKVFFGNDIEENPVMILNSIARLFDAKARSKGLFFEALPHSSRRIMRVIAKKEGLSQVELVKITHLSKPTVSLALKKMEDMGLVCRENDAKDLRLTKIYMTDKGKEIEKKTFETLHEIDRFAMQGLSDYEIKTLAELLFKMRENFLKEDDEK